MERHAVGRARAVVHLEVGAGDGQPLGHAENRRDTDAAGQQQAVRRFVRERKVVLRRADESTSPTFTCSCMLASRRA